MQARFSLIIVFAALVSATFTNAQEVEPYALKGGIVTPDQVLPDGLIAVEGPQIKEVTSSSEKRGGLREIETGSFIFPGLIDLHDHITWNLFCCESTYHKPGCLGSDFLRISVCSEFGTSGVRGEVGRGFFRRSGSRISRSGKWKKPRGARLVVMGGVVA